MRDDVVGRFSQCCLPLNLIPPWPCRKGRRIVGQCVRVATFTRIRMTISRADAALPARGCVATSWPRERRSLKTELLPPSASSGRHHVPANFDLAHRTPLPLQTIPLATINPHNASHNEHDPGNPSLRLPSSRPTPTQCRHRCQETRLPHIRRPGEEGGVSHTRRCRAQHEPAGTRERGGG